MEKFLINILSFHFTLPVTKHIFISVLKKKLSRYQPFEAIMKSRLKWINDKFYS